MQTILLSERQLCELEMLLNGSLYPLTYYMGQNDYLSVVEKMELSNGDFFPMPIYLDIGESKVKSLNLETGMAIQLCNSENLPLAYLTLGEIYQPDLEFECEKVYGTTDTNHPYVKFLLERSEPTYYLSGKLEAINNFYHSDFHGYRLTPQQSRERIANHGWDYVVGFQTRNPMHRIHYELTYNATKRVSVKYSGAQGAPKVGLLLTPSVGVTQECDIDYFTRVKCYIELLKRYEQCSVEVELILLPLAMRMAGPREALYHALIRRNYGCTHFIVGRDHAGPSYKPKDPSKSSFYGPFEAQELVAKYQDKLQIIPDFAAKFYYDPEQDQYLPAEQVSEERQEQLSLPQLSGTEFRRRLLDGGEIPSWFSFPETVEILRNHVRRPSETGFCIYCIGLSGSGKTTLVKSLKNHLMMRNLNKRSITILDADIIRQHLSKGLGFSKEDRSINVQRIGYVASEIVKHGGICLVANIAPYVSDRETNRAVISQQGHYFEVFVDTSVEVCEKRDVKGLYAKARNGEIKLTGVNDPFDVPEQPDFLYSLEETTDLDKATHEIIQHLEKLELIY